MKTTINALVVVVLLLVLAGCMRSPESAAGFRLPDGDAEFGQQAFLDLQCNACHTIRGVELPSIDVSAPVSVVLGGPVASGARDPGTRAPEARSSGPRIASGPAASRAAAATSSANGGRRLP